MPIASRSHLMLLVFALAGAFALLYATGLGIGISIDSLIYLQAARNFAAGHGVSLNSETGYFPLSQYPPMYCVFLAVPVIIGFDLLESARVMHSMIFAGNILLSGLLIFKLTKNTILSVLASFLMLTSIYVLEIHSYVWSEALFLLFAQVGFLLLAEYFVNGKRIVFFGAAVAISLAFLTRYAGIALAGAGTLAILIYSRTTLVKRIRGAGVFGAISFLPTAIWLALFRFGADVAHNEISFHPIGFDQLNSALYTISIFLLPEKIPGIFKQIGLALFLILSFILLARYWKHEKKAEALSRFPELAILFIVLYLLLLCLTATFYWASLPMDPRTFSPFFVAGLLLVLCLLPGIVSSKTRPIAGFLLILFAGSYLVRASFWLHDAHAEGLGYSSKTWHESKLLREVSKLPPETCLYTNDPYVIGLFLNRRTGDIPPKIDIVKKRRNSEYASTMDKIRQDLQVRGCRVVFFSTLNWQLYMPTEVELQQKLSLEPVAVFSEGTLYRAKPRKSW